MKQPTLFISIFISFIFAFFQTIYAQSLTQTIRGQVVDAETRQPLPGAAVYLLDTDPLIGTTTGEDGKFILEEVSADRYVLQVSFVGYQSYLNPELLVNTGKETVLQVSLRESPRNLEEVVISGESVAPSPNIDPVSSREFTVEESRRYAATFFDPARLATSFPGVVGTNDQANHISVRGNSPNSVLWRLEGIDIVNPNHLSNAGTFNDRRVQGGGSQSVLSAQMLGNSAFLTGAFPAPFGNSIGGVFDMKLRKGNSQQREYTAQLGLIGLEFAAEGPFKEGGEASYLANYRYSTVGLLTNGLGLDFGGEAITFQDLAFHLSLPTENSGEFSIFGMGGLGKNVFEAPRDSADWESQEDRYDVTFTNDMGVIGMTHALPINEQTFWRTSLAISALSSDRYGDRLDEDYNAVRLEEDNYRENRISLNTSLTRKLAHSQSLRGGLIFNNLHYDLLSRESPLGGTLQTLESGEGGGQLYQPYLQWTKDFTFPLSFRAGLHAMYFSLSDAFSLEPRATLEWEIKDNQSLSLAYGLHSQLQLPGIYFSSVEGVAGNPNQDLDFTKAHHYVLSYHLQWNTSLSLRTEAYYQDLFNVPISQDPNNTFSALNVFEGFVTEELVNEGTGKNYGLEVTLEKSLAESYYLLLSSSLYESKYTAADGVERDTRFNGNYAFSFTGGKEYSWNSDDKQRVLGINLRSVYLGGLRVTPIDAQASQQQQETIFIDAQAFSDQLSDYFKVDFRLSLRTNKAGYTSVWSLDLQNALNNQNVAFQYYDTVEGEVITKYQLGLIPILTYRVEF
ncbi:TonB-dependent receptor [Catalinimonas niigatensis]|uniref:TonB-dependent receptor n=1 Tax=Catalinimonas niigatensis TaxID=1397264 RepID=UPI0026659BC2|nr:TonB-dependent receptor [Catalinimonas niigatensis]WPP53464.1 TonB-dependent receptor [Catalinimonas niigatensis]